MDLPYTFVLATIVGIVAVNFTSQTDAASSKNFSRYHVDAPTVYAKDEFYPASRKKRITAQSASMKNQIAQTVARPAAKRQHMAEEALKKRRANEKRKAQIASLVLQEQHYAEDAEMERRDAEPVIKGRSTSSGAIVRTPIAKEQRIVEGQVNSPLPTVAEPKSEPPIKSPAASTLSTPAPYMKKMASINSTSESDDSGSINPDIQPSSKPTNTADKTKNCDNAKLVIGKYAFADIEAKTCTGDIYLFSATRDGKRFSIKISTITWELTEVTKISTALTPN